MLNGLRRKAESLKDGEMDEHARLENWLLFKTHRMQNEYIKRFCIIET